MWKKQKRYLVGLHNIATLEQLLQIPIVEINKQDTKIIFTCKQKPSKIVSVFLFFIFLSFEFFFFKLEFSKKLTKL
ncbi:hypothetical protein CCZ01_07265 [Helicobacter monodelphidis]|nr:hypothetical protein CCZ01_07265 [Helicobacter sp. 15-1451]